MSGIVVVLYRPEDPANIGAVVRAMKNMGFDRLRLVQPVPYAASDLLRVAHHCEDLVERIAVYADLEEALADRHFVVGTAAIDHRGIRTTGDIRHLAAELARRSVTQRIALLFGPEADGLNRIALSRCHLVASLPSNPDYPALNLAQSVLLFLYEARMATVGVAPPDPLAIATVAEQAHLERLCAATESALREAGFFRYNPAVVMRSLRQIAYRAKLQVSEVDLLFAMMRKFERTARTSRASDADE